MKALIRGILASILVSVSFATQASDTGSLFINVIDQSGNVVSNATVTAATEESLRSRSGMTNDNGNVKLTILDPSKKYVVEGSAVGFYATSATGITVVTGQSRNLTLVMSSSTLTAEEIVTVGSRERMVDLGSAVQGFNITLDITESLPTGRSYQDYLQLAPGIKPSASGNPSSKSGVNYADVGGEYGVSTDNTYFIDGVNVTSNESGLASSNLNSEIIQEQQVLTGALPAQYEGGNGLVSKVITKSGGNEFSGSVNYFFQNDGLVSDDDNNPGSGLDNYDAAFTLGGPIIKDKLWFFTSFQQKESKKDVVTSDGTFVRTATTSSDLGFLKLTYQATDADFITLSYNEDPQTRDGSNSPLTLENRNSTYNWDGSNTILSWTHTWDNMALTVKNAQNESSYARIASIATARNDVAYTDPNATTAQTDKGSAGSNLFETTEKDQFSIEFDYILETDRATHEFKAGYTATENVLFQNSPYSGDPRAQWTSIGTADSGSSVDDYLNNSWVGTQDFSDSDFTFLADALALPANAATFSAVDIDADGSISDAEINAIIFNSTAGNPTGDVNVYRIWQSETAPLTFKTKGKALFIQDTIYMDQWTFNVGVRGEEWDHYASDGSNIGTFDVKWAPRLSVTYDIDGKSKVWGFSGRYYDPIRTNMTGFAGTLAGSVRQEQLFVNGEWVTYRTRGGAQTQDAFFAPTTKTPYTDELSVGYSNMLTDDISLELQVTMRETRDILEDYDLGLYGEDLAGTDYELPLSYFGYTEMPNSNYVIATLEGGKRDYIGFEAVLRKRQTEEEPYFVIASYTNNQAEGNSNSDSNADFQGDWEILDPRAPGMYGDQAGNIEHQIKIAGSYFFENGIEVGAVYNWNSGYVYSKTFSLYRRNLPLRVDTAYVDGGHEARWVDPASVGAYDSGSYQTLDVRAKYVMDLNGYQAEFFVDVFNILDDQAATKQQDLAAGDGTYAFGEAVDWVNPRSIYLGARMSF